MTHRRLARPNMMKTERKFKAAAMIVFLVMLFVAIQAYRSNASSRDTLAEVRASVARAEGLDDLLSLLRDAETGQRGFIITGKENFLAPYYAALSDIAVLRRAMTDERTAPREEIESAREIFSVADLKLKELADTIGMRRASGFAGAEPVVSSGRGKQYMDTLRELIGARVLNETRRRDMLTAKFERESAHSFYLSLGATLANLALLALLLAMMFRVLRQRQATAAALRDTGDGLARSIAEARLRNDQMTMTAEMLQALGAISSLAETSRIIAVYCAKLLPGVAGTMYLFRNSRDLLEAQTSWGTATEAPPVFGPHDCWALQRGGMHVTRGPDDLCCRHYADGPGSGADHLCIPLVTQGEVIGLLHLEGLEAADATRREAAAEARELAGRVAEQIALALANVMLRETLRHQSVIDPLTGLFNRRYMDETIKRELSRAQRKAVPLSLIVLDLDHFKRVNDTFGHDAGDVLLKNVAQALRANIRESDLACRLGGEEMVLILPECDLRIAMQRAEAIRTAIVGLDVRHGGRTLGPATASFGVATFPDHGREADDLFHAADQALYRAKHGGRNRAVAAGD
ncbi:MAG: sensor domain-containing diguanylate cyclase [Burkholderiaceae bacterium]